MRSYTIKFGYKSVTLKANNVFEAARQAQKILGFNDKTPVNQITIV